MKDASPAQIIASPALRTAQMTQERTSNNTSSSPSPPSSSPQSYSSSSSSPSHENLPLGCPQCAVIQSIPSFGLSLFSLGYSIKYLTGGRDKRVLIPLTLIGAGYMYVGYNVYDITLNPSSKFDYYTPLGAGLGTAMIALSQLRSVRTQYPSPLHNNLLLTGVTAIFFYGARTYFLREKGAYNGWQ